MSQTSYAINQVTGNAGQLADSGFHDVISKLVQEAGGVNPGLGVVQGTLDEQALLPNASGNLFLGLALVSEAQVGQLHVFQGAMNVLRKGRAWVSPESAVVPGSAVYVRYSANGGNTVLGSFSAVSDSGHNFLVPNAVFMTSAAAAGLAQIELNLV